jgi:hypothetical protein
LPFSTPPPTLDRCCSAFPLVACIGFSTQLTIRPPQLLAKFLFRGQKKTEITDRSPRAEFLFSPATCCQSAGLDGYAREIFQLALPLLKGARVPITAMHSWMPGTAREVRAEAELRREAGRTGWPGQAQLNHIMK